jgi:hypothetical protein
VPLDAVLPAAPSPQDFRAGWGYLENCYPGWFLVDVTSHDVRARWQLIGKAGDNGEVRWVRAGEPELVAGPPAPERPSPPSFPLRVDDDRVAEINLRFAGMASNAPHQVLLNGSHIGSLPNIDYFSTRHDVTVPREQWPRIGRENELIVQPAQEEERCLAGFVLELTLADGTITRSRVDPTIYATTAKWDEWRWATPTLSNVAPDAPLHIPLNFT